MYTKELSLNKFNFLIFNLFKEGGGQVRGFFYHVGSRLTLRSPALLTCRTTLRSLVIHTSLGLGSSLSMWLVDLVHIPVYSGSQIHFLGKKGVQEKRV